MKFEINYLEFENEFEICFLLIDSQPAITIHVVVVRWQQGKNGKVGREETEGRLTPWFGAETA